MWGSDLLVGAWCFSLAGPIMAQIQVSFSSDYQWVMGPVICFVIVCLFDWNVNLCGVLHWLGGFSVVQAVFVY